MCERKGFNGEYSPKLVKWKRVWMGFKLNACVTAGGPAPQSNTELDQEDKAEDACCLEPELLEQGRELSAQILLLLMVFVFRAPQVLL